jgi:hypothetical protein
MSATVALESFTDLIALITVGLTDRPLDVPLEAELNARFPAHGREYQAVLEACQDGIASGWMCNREAGGIRYGRVIRPGPRTHGFSVDVVDMQPVAGPHHRHPNGEIDLVMPLEAGAQFDGHDAGWVVYGPGSAHHPTVTHGRALVLYLLPAGAIEFTRT